MTARSASSRPRSGGSGHRRSARHVPSLRGLALALALAPVLGACAGSESKLPHAPRVDVRPAGPLVLGTPLVSALSDDRLPAERPWIAALAADGRGGAAVLFAGASDRVGARARALTAEAELGPEIHLAPVPEGARGRHFWMPVGDGTWWLVASGIRPDLPTRVFRLGRAGSAEELEDLELYGATSAVAWPDGRFAVLCEAAGAAGSERHRRWSVVCFDAAGRELWRLGSDRDDLSQLHAPIAMVAAADGRLAVLEHVRERVLWLDAAGRALEAWDLHEAIGMGPDYLIGLAAGPGGGLLVSQLAPGHPMPRPDGPQRPAEQRFSEPLVWLDAAGKLVARISPSHGNGAPALSLAGRAVGVGEDRIVAADGQALYTIARDGTAAPLAGDAVQSARLDDPRAAVFDPMGAVYVLDGRSGAVHHFGAAGEPLGVYAPLAGDFAEVDLVELELAPTGGPALRTSVTAPHWIEFQGPGPRVARHGDGFPLAVDAKGGVWRRAGLGLERLDPSGNAVPLQTRADGAPARVAIHASGSAAAGLTLLDMAPVVLEGCLCFLPVDPDSMAGSDDTASYIALWDPAQRPLVSFRIPRDLSGKRVERAGGWVLLAGEGRNPELLRIADGALFAADLTPPPGPKPLDPRLRLGLSGDGRTLFALELGQRRLLRYPLPDPASVPGP